MAVVVVEVAGIGEEEWQHHRGRYSGGSSGGSSSGSGSGSGDGSPFVRPSVRPSGRQAGRQAVSGCVWLVGSGIKESVRRRPGCELAKFLSYIGRGRGAREFCRGLFFILFYFAFLRSIHRNAPIDGLDAVNDNFVPPLLLRQSVAGLSHGGWLPPSWPRSIRRLAAERSVSGAARCRLALSNLWIYRPRYAPVFHHGLSSSK